MSAAVLALPAVSSEAADKISLFDPPLIGLLTSTGVSEKAMVMLSDAQVHEK